MKLTLQEQILMNTFSDAPLFKQMTYYDIHFSIVELFINNISSYLSNIK